jgi:hypothetical protein
MAPVHAQRIQLENGAPVVADGPYAEAQEVLAGYWIADSPLAVELSGPPHAAKTMVCRSLPSIRTASRAADRPHACNLATSRAQAKGYRMEIW